MKFDITAFNQLRPAIPYKTLRLPYGSMIRSTQLLRKFCTVAGSFECFFCKHSRSSMMTMPCFSSWWEARHHNIRTHCANDPDNITQDFLLVPLTKGFFGIFRKTKINSTGKKLFTTVLTTSRHKLLRTNQSK